MKTIRYSAFRPPPLTSRSRRRTSDGHERDRRDGYRCHTNVPGREPRRKQQAPIVRVVSHANASPVTRPPPTSRRRSGNVCGQLAERCAGDATLSSWRRKLTV